MTRITLISSLTAIALVSGLSVAPARAQDTNAGGSAITTTPTVQTTPKVRAVKPRLATPRAVKVQANAGTQSNGFDNTAPAWTAGCYAEFGPSASNPDAALLQKCLDS
ncbi:hypothetical protein [uncultured Parasphingorhabdus sp.]|uniref:hypothetical protein n=1 Tax=uncultured Parasphingorhabdus sp. TaxID=2709694 RepID=UPI0030DBC14F|tara:strand:- start:27308 stop:27631 length:324 start_codon:yes stop_codon:yes gene_type:complete